MAIKDRIKAKRLELGYTLEELANMIGTSRQNVFKYENGIISNIPSDKIEALAKALKTTPAYLMGWDEDPNITQEDYYNDPVVAELAQQLKDRPELKVLFDASKGVSKDDIQFVIDMIERMK